MIDTIALLVPEKDFKIMNYEAFEPSARGLFAPPYYRLGKQAHFECYQNPTKTELKQGIYKPRLTLSKRMRVGGFCIGLKIEFSAPKLLFGNNFDELENIDFESVLQKLQSRLSEMSVTIPLPILKQAEVVGIHYGKNIILPEKVPCSWIIKTLEKLGISKRLDAGNTDFRNEGQAIRYHTNSYELTFYDKIKELAQSRISPRRSLEQDTEIQEDLFRDVDKEKYPEIMRLECRFNGKRKLKDTLIKIGVNSKSTQFDMLFNHEIAKRTCLYFWSYVEEGLDIVLMTENDIEEVYYQVINAGYPEMKALQGIGYLKMVQKLGMRATKGIMKNGSRTADRLENILKTLELKKNYLYDIFQQIKSDLNSFKSLKIDEYKIIKDVMHV